MKRASSNLVKVHECSFKGLNGRISRNYDDRLFELLLMVIYVFIVL